MKMKRIMGFFLALVMFIGCLPLNTIETYAAEGDVAIDEAHFPNENFRNYVKENFDTDKDGNLSQVERDHVKVIDVHYSNIGNLKGIEHFKNLTKLDCSSNNLTILDVSNNTALKKLDCRNIYLSKLDVSNNTALEELNCGTNHLSELDVSNNTALKQLSCSSNKLKKLDVSNNTALEELNCGDNPLSELDVSNNTALEKLYCYSNKLSQLDVSRNTALKLLNCSFNQLEKLYLGNIALESLDCNNNKQLEKLYVRDNTALKRLICCDNNLSELDVSNNTALEELNCGDNHLSELDVSNNTALKQLDCRNNKLKKLDVRNNTALEKLNCTYNYQIIELDVRNNTALKELLCYNDRLSKLDVSKNTALKELFCYNNKLSKLDVSKNTALESLNCGHNDLSELDVSKNTALKELYCYRNQLTNLDLSNVQLRQSDCSNQQYDITVNKDTREFKYSDFPGQFKRDKVTSPAGANFGDDALTVNSDNPNVVTYKYKVNDNEEMNVILVITYIEFDPENVVSMKVKTQPKLSYTEGEKLDLSELVVTLKDNQDLEKDVAFKDFEENNITAQPENDTKLTVADSGKKVTLTKENSTEETEALTKDVAFRDFASNVITTNLIDDTALTLANNGKALKLTKGDPITAETEALTVNKKETPPPTPTPDPPVVGPVDPTDPNAEKPADTSKYWTVTFKSEDETKGVVDAKNTVYLLKNSGKTLADLAKYAPKVTAKAGYEFDKWEPALDKNTVIDKDLTVKAYFKKAGTPTPQDPPVVGPVDPTPNDPPVVGPVDPTQPGEKPADTSKYWTVTFKADPAMGTMGTKNTFYVLKNSGKTLANLAKDAPKVTAKAGFKFTGWEPALDKNTSINGNLTVNAKFEKVKVAKKSKVANNKALPKTASSMNIELYTIFMILSAGLLVVAFKRKKES